MGRDRPGTQPGEGKRGRRIDDDEYDDDDEDDDEYDDDEDGEDDEGAADDVAAPGPDARPRCGLTLSRARPQPDDGRSGTTARATAGDRRPAASPRGLAQARAAERPRRRRRPPEANASVLYRLLRVVGRFVIFVVFRFRIRTSGQEHLPADGYLLVAAAHRGWMDPFVVMHAIPAVPRAWFLGSGPSTFTTRWRERLIHRVGGLLPVARPGRHPAARRGGGR
jgi:hypothetical protein